MATRFDATLVSDMTTDARFRAAAGFVEDTLVTTGGWLVSTETGDTAPASLAHPTVANTKKGFRVYKTNDGLTQIYMRIDYGGSGATSGNGFAMWLTIGTGSDGAGGITGKIFDHGSATGPTIASATATVAGNTGAVNSYGSASTGRVALGMFISSTAGNIIAFSLERTKDATGSATSDGLLLTGTMGNTTNGFGLTPVASSVDFTQYLITAGGTQPTVELGLNYVLTRNNPSETFGSDIGTGIIIHFKGASQQPGLGMLVVNSSDVSAEGNFTQTVYGATRTYQHLNSLQPCRPTTAAAATTNSAQRICIRYD